jgi:Icc-related predicted phosphoesterase
MPACFFVSDLHGREGRYRRLFERVRAERPAGLFLGGDLLPHWRARGGADFLAEHVWPELGALRDELGSAYPDVFLILGNDDPRTQEQGVLDAEDRGLVRYAHGRVHEWQGYRVLGYSFTPPSPFLLKDWERYDVSRYVDPGCVSPEEGLRTVLVDPGEARYTTIASELAALAGEAPLARAILLCHAPPHRTALDRAALDGCSVDHAPLDVHVGSIALRRFIELRQPRLTLHGHIHEAARLSGRWQERLGETLCLSAAHDGPELCLVRFDPDRPEAARRELLSA